MGIINEFVQALKPTQEERLTSFSAIVSSIDDEGVIWVYLAGSDTETPTTSTSAEIKKGDSVNVEWRNNRLYIVGNTTSPAVGTERIQSVEKSIESVNGVAAEALKGARIAGNTNQYFWHTQSGTDTGAHITEVPKVAFLADPTNGGGNLLARSNGVALRDGLVEVATFGTDGIEFSDDTDTLCTIKATSANLTEITSENGRSIIVGGLDSNDMVFGQMYLSQGVANLISITGSNQAGFYAYSSASGSSLSLMAGSVSVNGYTLEDFVTSKGVSGVWSYSKWKSGKVEAWGTVLFSTLTFAAAGALYKSVNNSFSIPSGIFSAAPTHGQAFIMGADMNYFAATVGGLSSTGGSCEVWKATSGNGSNVYVHIHLTYIPA